jgi:hypothetical protein
MFPRVLGSGLRAEVQRLLAEALDVPELDVLVASHEVGQAGDPQSALVSLGREIAQRALDHASVLGDEGTLDPADPGEPERIERGAAETAERDQ